MSLRRARYLQGKQHPSTTTFEGASQTTLTPLPTTFHPLPIRLLRQSQHSKPCTASSQQVFSSDRATVGGVDMGLDGQQVQCRDGSATTAHHLLPIQTQTNPLPPQVLCSYTQVQVVSVCQSSHLCRQNHVTDGLPVYRTYRGTQLSVPGCPQADVAPPPPQPTHDCETLGPFGLGSTRSTPGTNAVARTPHPPPPAQRLHGVRAIGDYLSHRNLCASSRSKTACLSEDQSAAPRVARMLRRCASVLQSAGHVRRALLSVSSPASATANARDVKQDTVLQCATSAVNTGLPRCWHESSQTVTAACSDGLHGTLRKVSMGTCPPPPKKLPGTPLLK
jgi:hypothetical protein